MSTILFYFLFLFYFLSQWSPAATEAEGESLPTASCDLLKSNTGVWKVAAVDYMLFDC